MNVSKHTRTYLQHTHEGGWEDWLVLWVTMGDKGEGSEFRILLGCRGALSA